MIFVTVGTHEQPFDRLIQCVDCLKGEGVITENVIIQTGFSTYEPRHCKWRKLFPYSAMVKYVEKARIIITHGGPSSFIMPLQIGKIPIVVPRSKDFHEHVNNHQVAFCNAVAQTQKNIIVVEDIDQLKDTILRYDTLVENMPVGMKSNNASFCKKFEEIVHEMIP